jgi:hypothetical protein
MCPTCFPRPSPPTDVSLPSTGSSRASSPASAVLSKRYDFLPPFSLHFVPFVWRYLEATRWFRSPADECTAGAWSWSPGNPTGIIRGDDRISQVPGESRSSVCTCSNPTPAGLLAPDHCDAAAWPLVIEGQRLPRRVFRRSIAWLSDSLPGLRRTGCPRTTPGSLPVAGQALLDGLPTRKIPLKGFKAVVYISFPFPKLSWRNR